MLHFRKIEERDNAAMAAIIRKVMTEFGAVGEGYSIVDPEVTNMNGAYSSPRSAYFVVTMNEEVVGGGGIAPLQGGDADTCELKKMYFLDVARGQGAGQQIMDLCLEAAREHGFKVCYLETLSSMTKARALYLRNGFELLRGPLGNTGHFGCDSWFAKKLR